VLYEVTVFFEVEVALVSIVILAVSKVVVVFFEVLVDRVSIVDFEVLKLVIVDLVVLKVVIVV
tara:strand:+ start:581 stop:769 length:189 start_codon:yes stop_codon:yes gene_type:complete